MPSSKATGRDEASRIGAASAGQEELGSCPPAVMVEGVEVCGKGQCVVGGVERGGEGWCVGRGGVCGEG